MFARLITFLFLALLAAQAGTLALAAAKSDAHDYTSELTLIPGLAITFPVKEGIDTRRKPLGDYNFFVSVIDAADSGYTYKWEMSAPQPASGTRAVTAEDEKASHAVSLFYHDKQDGTIMGNTNIVRVSDAIYNALKAGGSAPFKVDGPEKGVEPDGTADRTPAPTSIHFVSDEVVHVWLDDKRVPVHAIRAQTDNGWVYWILDNAKFPVMVGGAGPFYWQEPRFSYAEAEARRLAKDLADKGIATSHAILFAFDSDKLTPTSKDILKGVASYLAANPSISLQVEGHTDSVGGYDYNMDLSRRRAASVARYLVEGGGISADRLKPAGFGYTVPVASNATDAGRAQNRRVVFKKL